MIKKDSSPMAKTTLLRLADLPSRKATQISYIPDTDAMAQLAEEMDLSALRKMRLEGTLQPLGNKDWRLEARFGATVVQPCVVTLEPVTTRIEEPVLRQYLSDWQPPTDAEAEMDGDDVSEPLPDAIDIAEVAAEALALAVPRYPRIDGAKLAQTDFTEPGAEAMTDEDVKPFAGLASLKAKLENPDKH
ncbi:uncharacterized protein DUF177 involved in 23S rRNA accumulation [Litoreibacter halocynthiae]|uniref:Uncharacterized protein DUF177 involved in 23S rRNA accumulation n=2 Tax=Litoreibacter halocynthiae TaxID=1242689 RepID=A0A4R7LRZ7_9RHOB|nr:uncharacterized protein DUF177 involved in 23S rRNA accumulation [Litoreibacter halocynthiae]